MSGSGFRGGHLGPESTGFDTKIVGIGLATATPPMKHGAEDRRIHRVFVTRNTEYHLRRDLCVAVRDRNTGSWLPHHSALFRRATGAMVRVGVNGYIVDDGLPQPGDALVFDETVTTPVVAIRRPPASLVSQYPAFQGPPRPVWRGLTPVPREP